MSIRRALFLAAPVLIPYFHTKRERCFELAKELLHATHALGKGFSIRYLKYGITVWLMSFSMLCLQVMQASFGSSIKTLFGQQYTLSVASPADGCMALNNTGNVARTVVLVLRGSCYFAVKVGFCATHRVCICGMQSKHNESTVAWLVDSRTRELAQMGRKVDTTVLCLMQAQNAQAAGAEALLVYDDQISDYFVPASDGTIAGIRLPSGSIPRRTGQLLVSSLLVSIPLALPLCRMHLITSGCQGMQYSSMSGIHVDWVKRLRPSIISPDMGEVLTVDAQSAACRRAGS